ncbi:NAD(P)-dependent oxidoreductase [Treponema sp. HNW]|uniref:NAD(P)-dependent oxidoreductase n=1 Tax=Treponema sp. HNW TaxID=3116654 RepID=UPI003D118CF7
MNIAWIGAGVMGSSMARHLVQAGHKVKIYNRSPAKCEALKKYGIEPAATIAECVQGAQAVFTIVGAPSDVEQVYLGEKGIFRHAGTGAFLVDMTTSSPVLAKRLYDTAHSAEFAHKKFRVADAPVSGGDTGAQNATLSIMVGADKEDFAELLPLFQIMGKTITHIGPAGSGQHCKACNQIAIAGTLAGCAEAMGYAMQNGLNPEIILQAIAKGAAGSWQMDYNVPKMLQNDFAPGFFIKHFIKDMKIAQSVMSEQNKKLPVLDTVLSMFEELEQKGFAESGTQRIIDWYK